MLHHDPTFKQLYLQAKIYNHNCNWHVASKTPTTQTQTQTQTAIQQQPTNWASIQIGQRQLKRKHSPTGLSRSNAAHFAFGLGAASTQVSASLAPEWLAVFTPAHTKRTTWILGLPFCHCSSVCFFLLGFLCFTHTYLFCSFLSCKLVLFLPGSFQTKYILHRLRASTTDLVPGLARCPLLKLCRLVA